MNKQVVYVVLYRQVSGDVVLDKVFSTNLLAEDYVARKLENDFDDRSWVVFEREVDERVGQ